MTIYFAAANDRAITVISITDDGKHSVFRSRIKKHWLDKGDTRTQAALRLMEFLTQASFTKEEYSWRSLRRTVSREAGVSEVLFNTPGTGIPLKSRKVYSLDSAAVELWFRRVFQDYRDCLPPIVYSLQQDFECWTAEPWVVQEKTPEDLDLQTDAARRTHSLISQIASERTLAVQSAAAAQMEESVRRISMQIGDPSLMSQLQRPSGFGGTIG